MRGETLESDEFERGVRLGLGRPVLHVQSHGSARHRDAILHACLHNTTYDTQVEGFKTAYVLDLIDASGDVDFFRQHILHAAAQIGAKTDERDALHLLALLEALALRGDTEARAAVYGLFDRYADDKFRIGDVIIAIDGVDGFIHVLERLPDSVTDDVDDDRLVFVLEDALGEAETWRALAEVRARHADVDRYLERVETYRRSEDAYQPEPVETLTYADVRRRIEQGASINLSRWAAQADPDALEQAGRDLLTETDLRRIAVYLRLFARVPFPLNPQSLFPLIEGTGATMPIPALAIRALAAMQHPAVRDFALRLIHGGPYAERAVQLLARNFEPDDWSLIESLGLRTDDTAAYHSFGMSVHDVFVAHPERAAAATLRNIYEYGPCSHCRERVVRDLAAIDALTDSMRTECHYDSNEAIRELARNGFAIDGESGGRD